MSIIPWDFIEDGNPESGVPNEPSPEGIALGEQLARLTLPGLERVKKAFPNAPGPCGECAFVLGTVPNQSLATVANALKCTIENVPFYCHKGVSEEGKPRRLCAGYAAAMTTAEDAKP